MIINFLFIILYARTCYLNEFFRFPYFSPSIFTFIIASKRTQYLRTGIQFEEHLSKIPQSLKDPGYFFSKSIFLFFDWESFYVNVDKNTHYIEYYSKIVDHITEKNYFSLLLHFLEKFHTLVSLLINLI